MDIDDSSADPVDVAAYLEDNPREALARSRARADPRSTDLVERRLAWVLQLPEGPDRIGMMREALAELDEDAQLRLALRFPAQIGDCHNGAPINLCIAANRVNITGAIVVAEDRLRDLRQGQTTVDTPAAIEKVEATLDVYRGLLAPPDPTEARMSGSVAHRQILYFNPTEDCGIIEFNGDPSTAKFVVTVTTGAATDIKSYPMINGIARDYMRAHPPGEIAIVTYAPGDYPAQPGASLAAVLVDAFRSEYARKTAPRLVTFGNDILRPLMKPDAKLTALGFSYGGVTAGTAARLGFNVDRLLLVLAPGGGLEVHSIDDYRRADGKRMEVFSLTNRTDFVYFCRILPPHLGANPQLMDGVVNLQSARYAEAPGWLPELQHIADQLADVVFEPGTELGRSRLSHVLTMTTGSTGPLRFAEVVTYQPVLTDDSNNDLIGLVLLAENTVMKAARTAFRLFDRAERPMPILDLSDAQPSTTTERPSTGRRHAGRRHR